MTYRLRKHNMFKLFSFWRYTSKNDKNTKNSYDFESNRDFFISS